MPEILFAHIWAQSACAHALSALIFYVPDPLHAPEPPAVREPRAPPEIPDAPEHARHKYAAAYK